MSQYKYKNDTLNGLMREIKFDITNIVKDVRKDLRENPDTSKDANDNRFTNLCNIACTMCFKRISQMLNEKYQIAATVSYVHGEQAHTSLIPSKYWSLEHSWISVQIILTTIYVDPTSGQFADIYHDIPDYYVSEIPPKWYYPDKKNWTFNNRIGMWFREHIRFNLNIRFDDGQRHRVNTNVVEFIQYHVWGSISDLIHKIKTK